MTVRLLPPREKTTPASDTECRWIPGNDVHARLFGKYIIADTGNAARIPNLGTPRETLLKQRYRPGSKPAAHEMKQLPQGKKDRTHTVSQILQENHSWCPRIDKKCNTSASRKIGTKATKSFTEMIYQKLAPTAEPERTLPLYSRTRVLDTASKLRNSCARTARKYNLRIRKEIITEYEITAAQTAMG